MILRMGYVPVVDATGANIITEFVKKLSKYDTKIIFPISKNSRGAFCTMP